MESAKQSQQDLQLRVFISSTFRDMHAERNYLVKFIFPQLRRLYESRGVTWGEVDLRWGVPDEAAAEGKVLPICLEEINRCRPYFIGLLGERYGWVPDSIPEELLEKEKWLQEQFREHKSVTELEILHGVLRNPDMAGNAFFYFRDPSYVHSLPEKARKDFNSENSDDAENLHRLSILLDYTGNSEEALRLRSSLVQHFRDTGDLFNLEASLVNQAGILYQRGQLDEAIVLLKEKEQICHQLGNMDGLSKTLGNQALILADRGKLDEATALLKEAEQISRQLSNPNMLAISLINQALCCKEMGSLQEGFTRAKEAHRLATQHGYASLASQIGPILDSLRHAAQE